ncbi:MAG: hypothetical protein AAF108_05480 [Planctomycetota bacterium]
MPGLRAWIRSVGLTAPAHGHDPYRQRRGEPRGFALAWTAFLIVSTGACFFIYGAQHGLSPVGYRSAVKVLAGMMGVGVGVLWPLFRLSQAPANVGGGGVVARDVVILSLPMQAVLWPQALVAGWSVEVIGAVALSLTLWAALAGGLVAMAIGPGGQPRSRTAVPLEEAPAAAGVARNAIGRSIAMGLLCIGVILGVLSWWAEPSPLAGAASPAFWGRMLSPVTAPLELCRDRVWSGQAMVIESNHWRAVLLTAVLAALSWVLAAVTGLSSSTARVSG